MQSALAKSINRYFVAQMFLTRLPAPKSLRWSETELAASTVYFPVVGIVVGAIAAMAWYAGMMLWSENIAALLAVGISILTTGAFHEDGLADSADGLGGAFEVNRKLQIMRDSRIGTYGSVLLIIVIMAKVFAISAIAPTNVAGALIAAHVIARWTSLPLIYNNVYVREEGTGKPFAATVTNKQLYTATAVTALITIAATGMHALIIIPLVPAFVWLAQRYLRNKLGGVTGDVLGAVNSLSELLVYLILSASVAAM
jgi:adenosylcobinamide-GDP ribazoletransferase